MNKKELEFYNKIKDWDFTYIKMIEDKLTNWDLYKELNKYAKSDSRILDLGTAGGEKVLKYFPDCKEIVGTDLAQEIIETANKNLEASKRKNIKFYVMDNLNMTTEDEYFDIVVARNTIIDAKQVYKTLKKGGVLLLHDVDKYDCWDLKQLFGYGQSFNNDLPISIQTFNQILEAGFKNIKLTPIFINEYYKTKEDLLTLLYKTPILRDFDFEFTNNIDIETINDELIDKYIVNNSYEKGILLKRVYLGLIAFKEG